MRTKPLQSPRLLKKRRKRIIMRIVLTLLGLVVVVALPAFLLRLSFWNIKTVSVSGIKAVAESDVQAIAEESLQGKYFRLFPRSNILIYPKGDIEKNLRSSLQRIDAVSVNRNSLTSIDIHVTERAPVALWCGSASSTDCYFLDRTGLIFDRSPEFSNNVYVMYSGSVSDNPLGKQFLDSSEFDRLQDFVSTVKSLSLSPVSISPMPNSDYLMVLPGGEELLFTTREPLEQTISNLQSVLSDQKLSVREGNDLLFTSIDLRYGNKVFFKKKADEPVEE